MNRLLFPILLVFSFITAASQPGYLFVKKGYKKKKTYLEGDRIILQVNNDTVYSGLITLLLNDTIYINGRPIPRKNVTTVLLTRKEKKKFHLRTKDILLTTAGVALATAGLTLSNQADFKEALTAGLVIGYSPILLQYAGSKISLRRKKYKIGKKYYLQMLEFHIPKNKGF